MSLLSDLGSKGIACLSVLLVLVTTPTIAQTRLVIDVETSISLNGRPYLQREGMLQGDFQRSDNSSGQFSVPVLLQIPQHGCNGVAILDLVNSVLFEFPATDELGHILLPFGRLFLGADLISGRQSGRGFSYMSLQWHKLVADETGIGNIERGSDSYPILAAAADYLREQQQPCAITQVIGFGWSQTGKLLAELLTTGKNQRPSQGAIFDSLFLGVAGGRCRSAIDAEYPWHYRNCDEPASGHVPSVAFNTQSEIELSLGDGALRTPSTQLHIYDYAGLAHIDAQFLPYSRLFAALASQLGIEFMQNPVSVIPGVRASFWALYRQLINSGQPPRSQLMQAIPVDQPEVRFVDLRANPDLLTWSGGKVHSADIDADGVADGGVRMPHLPSRKQNGSQLGAPLGLYGGIDYRFAASAGIFFANGGSFAPYSTEQLAERYPSRKHYLRQYKAALQHLVAKGYLLVEDGKAMLSAIQPLNTGLVLRVHPMLSPRGCGLTMPAP